jgi:hypothetical protein
MPRPICFMIMPYGIKPTANPAPSGAPDKVSFDRLWEAALRPAIDAAGYEPVRANEDIGGLIITEMIERLAISDLVLADVSIPNGNVYYEVGIRHAAQKQGCILTAATWAKPLFDIDQMRQIRYPLPTESISDEIAIEIASILKAAIPIMSSGASPFIKYFRAFRSMILPGLQPSRKAWQNYPGFRRMLLRFARLRGRNAGHARSICGTDTIRAVRFKGRSRWSFYMCSATARIGQRPYNSSILCLRICGIRHW